MAAAWMAVEVWEAHADRRGYAYEIPELLPEIQSLPYSAPRKALEIQGPTSFGRHVRAAAEGEISLDAAATYALCALTSLSDGDEWLAITQAVSSWCEHKGVTPEEGAAAWWRRAV